MSSFLWCNVFIKFKLYVECFFEFKIKSMQSNWRGKYRPLNKLLLSHGILHRISCPHTHQQNGAIERKHHHIVETGLALLSNTNIPSYFWDDAFSIACYLINRMPTPLRKNKSPFETLFKRIPDYKFLRTFVCVCWPNLRLYNSHKLQPMSNQCLFLGYSPQHKGYKCRNLNSNRLYISRDVHFDEITFPCSLNSTQIPSQDNSSLQGTLSIHIISPMPVIIGSSTAHSTNADSLTTQTAKAPQNPTQPNQTRLHIVHPNQPWVHLINSHIPQTKQQSFHITHSKQQLLHPIKQTQLSLPHPSYLYLLQPLASHKMTLKIHPTQFHPLTP
jgi:hypothetical protein